MTTQPQYLFLCGVGRSGTTVLRTSLGQHSQIYYNGLENNLVQDLLRIAEDNCTNPSRQFAMAVEQAEYDAVFRKATEDLIWPDQGLRNRPVWLAAINPEGRQLDYLRQVFPVSRVIGLIRNGIEVVCSRMKYRSFSAQSFENHCRVWNRCAGVQQWGSAHPDYFFQMRQEWFYEADALAMQLERLFGWLQIESDPAVLSGFQTLVHPTGDSAVLPWQQLHGNEKSGLFQQKRDGWKDWDASQREVFERICGPLMCDLGYDIPW